MSKAKKRLIPGNASGENKKLLRFRYLGCNLTSKVRPKHTARMDLTSLLAREKEEEALSGKERKGKWKPRARERETTEMR